MTAKIFQFPDVEMQRFRQLAAKRAAETSPDDRKRLLEECFFHAEYSSYNLERILELIRKDYYTEDGTPQKAMDAGTLDAFMRWLGHLNKHLLASVDRHHFKD